MQIRVDKITSQIITAPTYDRWKHTNRMQTSGRRILTKSHITVSSPLPAANGFVRLNPHLIRASLSPHEPVPNRHVDRISRFAGLVNMSIRHMDRSIVCSRKTFRLNGFNTKTSHIIVAYYFRMRSHTLRCRVERPRRLASRLQRWRRCLLRET